MMGLSRCAFLVRNLPQLFGVTAGFYPMNPNGATKFNTRTARRSLADRLGNFLALVGGGASSLDPMVDENPSPPPMSAAQPPRADLRRIPAPPEAKPAPKGRLTPEMTIEFVEVVGDTEPDPGDPASGIDSPIAVLGSPVEVEDVYFDGVGQDLARRLQARLAEAAKAFEAERFIEADRLLGSIENLAPGTVEVIELRGLTWYRLGRWRKAAAELERFGLLTASTEQFPVLADCYRALRRWTKVDGLWDELKMADTSTEVLEEGRLVMAGALVDQGKMLAAIRLLESEPIPRPALMMPHHLKRWYALADLYERSGDLARARRSFADLAKAAPRFGDVQQRAASLA